MENKDNVTVTRIVPPIAQRPDLPADAVCTDCDSELVYHCDACLRVACESCDDI